MEITKKIAENGMNLEKEKAEQPCEQMQTTSELSDGELEQVAGGGTVGTAPRRDYTHEG